VHIPRPNNVRVSNHSASQIWTAVEGHLEVIIVLGSASVFDRTFFDKSHLWPVTSYVRKTTANVQQVPHRNSSAKHTAPSLCAASLSDIINPQCFSAADRSIRESVLGQKPYAACFFNRLGNSCTSNDKNSLNLSPKQVKRDAYPDSDTAHAKFKREFRTKRPYHRYQKQSRHILARER